MRHKKKFALNAGLACPRKVAFPTREAAELAIRDMRERGSATCVEASVLTAYKCPLCKAHHVGKNWKLRTGA